MLTETNDVGNWAKKLSQISLECVSANQGSLFSDCQSDLKGIVSKKNECNALHHVAEQTSEFKHWLSRVELCKLTWYGSGKGFYCR